MQTATTRRQLLVRAASSLALGTFLSQRPLRADDAAIQWHNVRDWGVEGRGWSDTEKYFDRLPASAKGAVRDAVWSLSRHSAGMLVRFHTDATQLWADYTVTNANLAMPHMPATGVSGLDLYADNAAGERRWVNVVKPTGQSTRTQMVSGLAAGARDSPVYLPLYNGTESLQIGIPSGATFTPIAPRSDRPLVFYGTSITHGACASRTGMPHPAILGRRLQLPVINLGFSGNGRMEAAVGALLAELDAAVFIIDCLPNMTGPEVAERTEPLVRQLREHHPETPILLVEDRTYSNTWIMPDKQQRHAASRAALRSGYERLLQAGVTRLHYLEGDRLLGTDLEDTTDGSHPSDLGFQRHADAFEPVLRTILKV